MKTSTCLKQCQVLKKELYRIADSVKKLPEDSWVLLYKSISDVKELEQVLKWETACCPTTRQVAHIHSLTSIATKLNQLLKRYTCDEA